jgi:hypothetical protein
MTARGRCDDALVRIVVPGDKKCELSTGHRRSVSASSETLLSEMPVVASAADFQLLDRQVVEAVLQFRDRQPFHPRFSELAGIPSVSLNESVRLPRDHFGTHNLHVVPAMIRKFFETKESGPRTSGPREMVLPRASSSMWRMPRKASCARLSTTIKRNS